MHYDQNLEQDMEMPTLCQRCNKWFDLNDGLTSEKWFHNTVICKSCGKIEDKEIEVDEEIEELEIQLSDAKWTVENCEERLAKLRNP